MLFVEVRMFVLISTYLTCNYILQTSFFSSYKVTEVKLYSRNLLQEEIYVNNTVLL